MLTQFKDGTPIPMTVYWEGEPIEGMDKPRLIAIVTKLVEERDKAREAEHQRRLSAFDYVMKARPR